jgi:osmotically-inducible protein OsmY
MSTTINSFMKTQDQRIQDDVMRQIAWQPEVVSKDISVKALDANVTLTGFVHGYLEKVAAERAAKAVFGVVSVANDIEVKPASVRTDPETSWRMQRSRRIRSRVCAAL